LLQLVRRTLMPVLVAGLREASPSPASTSAIDEGAKTAVLHFLDTTFPKANKGAASLRNFIKHDMEKALEKWTANSSDSFSILDPEAVMQFMLSGAGSPREDRSPRVPIAGGSPLTTLGVMIITAFESMLAELMDTCSRAYFDEPCREYFDPEMLPSFKPWHVVGALVKDDELLLLLPEFAKLAEEERSATAKAIIAQMKARDADWIACCQHELTTDQDTYLDTRDYDDAAAELTKALSIWGTGLPQDDSRGEFCARVVDGFVKMHSSKNGRHVISEKALWKAMGLAKLVVHGEHKAKHRAITQPSLNREPKLECGEVLLRLGHYAVAESCFLAAPRSKAMLLGLGEAVACQGDRARALEAFLGAIESS